MLDLIKTFLIRGIQLVLFMIVIWLLYFVFSFLTETYPNIIPTNFKNLNPFSAEETVNESFGKKIYNLFPDFNFLKPVNSTVRNFILND